MNVINNKESRDLNWKLFCFFVFISPFLAILNLPRFNLRILGLGWGVFLTYLLTITLLVPKLRFSFLVQKIMFFLGLLIALLAFKFTISGSFFNFAKHSQMYFLSLVFFFLSYAYVDSNKKREQLKNVFIVISILLAIFGIIHYHFFYRTILADTSGYSSALMTGILDRVNMKYRESGTLPHPVHYSHVLSFGIIFLVFCMRSRSKWLFIAILFYAITISGSRSSFYYMLLFLLVIQINFRKINRTGLLAALVFMLGAVYFTTVYNTFDLSNIYNSGISIRIVKIKAAFMLASKNLHNFFIGVPLGFRPAMLIKGWGNQSVNDNSLASILAQVGIVGIFLWTFIIKTIYLRVKKLAQIKLDLSTENYIKAVKWCAISCLIFGLTNSLHNSLFPTAFMYIFLGSIFSNDFACLTNNGDSVR